MTAGPTYEAIDPVRFIGNHSSGKMGFAIAEEIAKRGAMVTLIAGPSNLKTIHSNIKRINVVSAFDMYNEVMQHFESVDCAVMSAAVADFTPKHSVSQKIKSNKKSITLELTATKDIAECIGKLKTKQIIVGFALETNDEEANALKKIKKKNFDFIVLNSLNDKGAGFRYDTNKVTIIDNKGIVEKFELKPKAEVAIDIVNKISTLFSNK